MGNKSHLPCTLPPLIARDVRDQKLPDERFFYIKPVEGDKSYVMLQLANQPGR